MGVGVMLLCKRVIWTLFQSFGTFPRPPDHFYSITSACPWPGSASSDYIPIGYITFMYTRELCCQLFSLGTTRLPAYFPQYLPLLTCSMSTLPCVTLLYIMGLQTDSGCFLAVLDFPQPPSSLVQCLLALGFILFSYISYISLNYIC